MTHVIVLGFVLVSLILSACGGDDKQAEKELTQTSIQFSWVHNVEFCGFYAAEKEGYYADAGLEVRFDSGGFDENGNFIDPVDPVLAGQADFGVTGADVLLKRRAEGAPLVAIATIYQRSPVVLISLSDSGILRPQDFVRHRVSTQPGNTTVGLAYEAMMTLLEIDRTDIDEVMRTDFTTNPLFEGEADVLAGFVTTEGVQVKMQDPDAHFILASDYGVDIYSNVIFTTEDMVANNPDLVLRFLEATLKGTQWAVEHPTEITTYFLDTYGQAFADDEEAQVRGMQLSIPLLDPSGSDPGKMKAGDWDFTAQMLLELGMLDEALDVDEAYTLQFLNEIYQ